MNARALCFLGWLSVTGLCNAQSPSALPAQSWRQLIQQWPKAGADLEAAGDELADGGHYAEAAARYESWKNLPEATTEQKALATIKLAQLAEAQFQIDQARNQYQKALLLAPPKSAIAHEIRLRIEDSYRRQGNLPALVKWWQTHLESHGDDPEAGLLLANDLAELRRPEEDAPWPHKVIASISSDVPTNRLASARAAHKANRVYEEREALAAAFSAESDPLSRLAMAGEMAESFARSGSLEKLVADFRTRARTETDGWRYSVYLAEIRRSAHDTSGAQAELTRAFGPRSRDVLFLIEAWRIAVDLKNNAERARLARLLAEIDPGTPREIELVSALLRNGENGKALQGLRANEDAIAAAPMKWHDVLLQAGAAGLGQTTEGLLKACLARQADDWRLRFLVAEASLQLRDFTTAEKRLRELETAAPATTPASPVGEPAPDDLAIFHSIDGITYDSGTGHGQTMLFTRRNLASAETRQVLKQIAAGFDGISPLLSQQFLFPTSDDFQPERPLPTTAAQAADAALVIRSVLAQHQGQGPQFVTELEATLSKLPRAERIARLCLVQALDPLLRELTAEAAAPSGDAMTDATGLEVLLCLGMNISPALGQIDVDPATLIHLLESFLAREKHADTLVRGKMELSKLLKKAGREKEAAALARESLDQWTVFPPSRRYEALSFALDNADAEHTEAIIDAMEGDTHKANPNASDVAYASDRIRLAMIIAQQKPNDPRVVKALLAALRDTYTAGSPNLSFLAVRQGRSVLQVTHAFPYGSRLTDLSSMTWSTIFEVTKQAGQIDALRAEIAKQDLEPSLYFDSQLAAASFAWWSQDRETAIRHVLDLTATYQPNELLLLAGSMLAETGRADEARKCFERISATDGEIAVDKIARLLALARAMSDVERAKTLALQLTEFPLNNLDQSALQGILTDLGLEERAKNYRSTIRAQEEAAYYPRPMIAVERMQRQAGAGQQAEAVALARNILASVSPLGNTQTERYQRISALETLQRAKAINDYADDLHRQLTAAPTSIETLLRLAEALARTDAPQSIALYRRAVEASPNDLTLQLRLAKGLALNHQEQEAVRVWEAAFAKSPQAVFGDDFSSVFNAYKTAKQLDRLSAVLVKAPAHANPLEVLVFNVRDTSFFYQQMATAMRSQGHLAEAIQLWQTSLAHVRENKSTAYAESTILQSLLPALLEAGRKEDAAKEIEDYFFPPPTPHPALGYEVKSIRRTWSDRSFGSNGKEFLQGAAVLQLAESAGAMDRLQAKAAAAHPEDPERLLVLWIDILRRDPAKLESLKKELDATIDHMLSRGEGARPGFVQAAGPNGVLGMPTPWALSTAPIVRALADALAEWPEGRKLALHVYARMPENATAMPGWIKLRRAEIALSIPEKEDATRALREWLAWNNGASSLLHSRDTAQELSAVELMSSADMPEEATTLFKKMEATGELKSRSDLKKRVEELSKRLTPPAQGK